MTSRQFVFSPWRKSGHSSGSEGQCVEVAAFWRKSSHSGGGGSSCVEVASMWRKSSHSGSEGQECVEVAVLVERGVALRDSKDADGPLLSIAPSAWASLLGSIKDGSLDLTS